MHRLAAPVQRRQVARGRLRQWCVDRDTPRCAVKPGTPLVSFPADEFCLYVIDITKRTCTNILYTRHPAGSLRGLPIVAHGGKRDLLLWSQALAPGRAEIKPYALPIEQTEQKPNVIDEALGQLKGLSAPPWHDANRLAVLTEAGTLSLWGFRQKGTRDPLLFPLLFP